jgi:hypothetical protein
MQKLLASLARALLRKRTILLRFKVQIRMPNNKCFKSNRTARIFQKK